MLVSEDRGKLEYPEKNLLEQGQEPTTNSTHIWCRVRESSPGHIGGDGGEGGGGGGNTLTTAPSLLPRIVREFSDVNAEGDGRGELMNSGKMEKRFDFEEIKI